MIYVDGGSNTYGDELEDRLTQAWPAQLSKMLNKEVLNNSIRGKSYQHMIFDTINFCIQSKPEMVIIAFGPIGRKLFVRRENNFYVDMSVTGSNSIYYGFSEEKKFRELLFKYWSNTLHDSWVFMQQVCMLQDFLNARNVKYLLINDNNNEHITKLVEISSQHSTIKEELLDAFDQMSDEQILEIENSLKKLYNQIDHTHYYDFNWHFKKLSWFEYHPSAEQQTGIANFIFNIIHDSN